MRKLPKNRIKSNLKSGGKRFHLYIFFSIVTVIFIFGFLQVKKGKTFNSFSRINVVFKSDPLVALSFPNYSDESIVAITLPTDSFVDVPWGYGPYKLDSLTKLGNIEKKSYLLQESISDLVGSAFVGFFEPKRNAVNGDITGYLKSLAVDILLSREVQTNIKFIDRFHLAWKIFFLKPEKMLVFNTHNSEFLFTQIKLPDGSVAKMPVKEALDKFLEQKLEDRIIREQNLLVTVLNDTKTPQVAQKFARFVVNSGGRVISLGNSDQNVSGCLLETTQQNANKKLVQLLVKNFGCELVLKSEVSGSDLIVYVGNIWGERWPVR